jgi:hypothetical protein
VRRNPNPQTKEHEAASTRAALAVKFLIPAKHRRFVGFPKQLPTRGGQRLIWFRLDVLCQPVVLAKRLEVSQTGYNQVSSPKICSKPARSSQQILHDRHMEIIYFLDAQEAVDGRIV